MSTVLTAPKGLLATDQPDLWFEDNSVGRMKKEIWGMNEDQLKKVLSEYGFPAAQCEWAKPGAYIQTTPWHKVVANRRKNDVVLIPVGCTELHGDHLPTATDTLFVSMICEGVRRFTEKNRDGHVNIALPPLNYGAHPYHHVGMPGTVIVREMVVREMIIDAMLGLWNMGFRKQVVINNHGQLWVLESAIQEFQKRYQLPGIFRTLDWHRGVREMFRTKDRGGDWDTTFVHADEAETSLGLYLFPDMVDMTKAVDTEPRGYLPDGHFDKSVDPFSRPHRWSEGEGHFPIEIAGTPEGVVGKATHGDARKALRPLATILRYLTLVNDEIIKAFPSGKLPPVEETTLRTKEEMEPYIREPMSPGWKPVYALPRLGQINE